MKHQSKSMPRIEKFMTPLPFTVKRSTPITEAIDLMRTQRIRHLPVLDESGIAGILTDRDIKLAASLDVSGNLTAGDVMVDKPYCVGPDASVDQVVFEMAEKKLGCAIVRQNNGKLVGIFTATDGLRVLGEILVENYRPFQA